MQTQTNHQLMPVQFQGATLFLTEEKKDPYVPMKPIVEGMGLTWSPQLQKLNSADSRWKSTMSIIDTVGADGKKREMVCLPLKKLPGWLMSIHPSKVNSAIRDRVITYQNECDDVLWEHWSGTKKEFSKSKINSITEISRELTAATNMAKIFGFSPNFARVKAAEVVSKQYGINTAEMFGLDLNEICPKERMDEEIQRIKIPTNATILNSFWALIYELESIEKHVVNWSKDPDKIAINLTKVKRICLERGIPMPEALNNKMLLKESVNPRFVAANINQRHVINGSQSRCWIFES